MARIECSTCHRPAGYCYCQNLNKIQSTIDLLILQHPNESNHSLNTAQIAMLGISNCQIIIGEKFNNHTLVKSYIEKKSACLLFPTLQASTIKDLYSAQEKPECCIIIDGTWRQSRKILHCNTELKLLPAITLKTDNASKYRIRKTCYKNSLSTVEAIVTFLRQKESNDNAYQHLLDAFTFLIDSQINAMGTMTYKKNYAKPI